MTKISVFSSVKMTTRFWRLSSTLARSFDSPTGNQRINPARLLAQPLLVDPSGFAKADELTRAKSDSIVQQIDDYASGKLPNLDILASIDAVSNTLCNNMDLTGCFRLIHPSPSWKSAAQESHMNMLHYLEGLNGHVGLFKALSRYMTSDEFRKSSPAAKRAAELYLLDFQQNGIHLSDDERRRILDLTQEMFTASTEFENAVAASEVPLGSSSVPRSLLLDEVKKTRDRKQRLQLFALANKEDNVITTSLHKLVLSRNRIARSAGLTSYASKIQRTYMATTPQVVTNYLSELSKGISSKAAQEAIALKAQIESESGSLKVDEVHFSDFLYFSNKIAGKSLQAKGLSPYFALGVCIEGFSFIVSQLYGVRFDTAEPAIGELWNSSVVKLSVKETKSDCILGTIYIDPYSSNSKPHMTHTNYIKTGCRVNHLQPGDIQLQKPVVVLSCCFSRPTQDTPSLLSFSELQTLFHELGTSDLI